MDGQETAETGGSTKQCCMCCSALWDLSADQLQIGNWSTRVVIIKDPRRSSMVDKSRDVMFEIGHLNLPSYECWMLHSVR